MINDLNDLNDIFDQDLLLGDDCDYLTTIDYTLFFHIIQNLQHQMTTKEITHLFLFTDWIEYRDLTSDEQIINDILDIDYFIKEVEVKEDTSTSFCQFCKGLLTNTEKDYHESCKREIEFFQKELKRKRFSTIVQKVTEREIKKFLSINKRIEYGYKSAWFNIWLFTEQAMYELPIKEKIAITKYILTYQTHILKNDLLDKVVFNDKYEFDAYLFNWVNPDTVHLRDGFILIMDSGMINFCIRIRKRYLIICQDQDY